MRSNAYKLFFNFKKALYSSALVMKLFRKLFQADIIAMKLKASLFLNT